MSLCETCQKFDIQSWAREPNPWRGFRLQSTLKTALDGCPFCSLLVNCFPHVHWPAVPIEWNQRADANGARSLIDLATRTPGWARGQWILATTMKLFWKSKWFHIRLIQGDSPCDRTGALDVKKLFVSLSQEGQFRSIESIDIQLWRHESVRAGPYHLFELHVAADPESPAALSGDITGQFSEEDTGSSKTIEFIRSWLSDCVSCHPECSQTLSGQDQIDFDTVQLPSRCIEVGDDLFLRLSNTSAVRGKYITLSHRWVPELLQSVTTRENYSRRLESLDTNSLPRHFRDVCFLAHALRVRYVWIDCVCIIQDSPTDWKEQASRMADYYQQSYTNIAVTIPDATLAGIFCKAGVESLSGFTKLPYRDKSGAVKGTFYAYGVDVARQYRAAVDQSELLTRGWVFQEWLLSRRILCFHAGGGIFVQCQRLTPRNLPHGDVVALHSRTRQFGQVAPKTDLLRLDRLHAVEDTFRTWRSMVEAYSALQLTKAGEDRIIALAGVAQEVGRAIRSKLQGVEPTMLAGLWLEDLARGLLWEQIEKGPHERLTGISTWSWASINTGVKWSAERGGKPHQKINMEVLGVVPLPALDRAPEDVENEQQPGPSPQSISQDSRNVAALRVRGVLLPVTIHGHGPTPTDIRCAADVTGHTPDSGRQNWRLVTTGDIPPGLGGPSSPSAATAAAAATGWASVEEPELQSGADVGDCFALNVADVRVFFCGFGLGYVWPYHDVRAVVFLRRMPGFEHRYRRVGVGRLFGKKVDALISRTDPVEAVLI